MESVLVRVVTYNCTFGHTLGTSHTSVCTVESVLVWVVTFNGTFGHTQGSSHTNGSTVESALHRVAGYNTTFGQTHTGVKQYSSEHCGKSVVEGGGMGGWSPPTFKSG